MFNKIYTKIKELFNIKIIIKSKKENSEFKSKIPEYTKWIIPIKFMQMNINNKPLQLKDL